MNTPANPRFGAANPRVSVARSSESDWLAHDATGRLLARGAVTRRPGGKTFCSVDAWAGSAFDALATATISTVDGPVYTLVDSTDTEMLERWRDAGFVESRSDGLYRVPTDRSSETGLSSMPVGLDVIPCGAASPELLAQFQHEVGPNLVAFSGWADCAVAQRSRPNDALDHRRCLAATGPGLDRYVGALDLLERGRVQRIGAFAVLPEFRQRGIGRALLRAALEAARGDGYQFVAVDVDTHNRAAASLLSAFGARCVEVNIELVRGPR